MVSSGYDLLELEFTFPTDRDFRDAVKQYLFDTCVKNHWYVKRMETDQDHVHILLQYNPTDSITHIVSILK